MKCPLFSIVDHESREGKVTRAVDCLQEECAWWDKTVERCGIKLAEEELDSIRVALFDLVEKMPHAGQFTK